MILALALAVVLSASGAIAPVAAATGAAQNVAGLEGVVSGPAGQPVDGAYVYVYRGEFPALGRPPDFISGRTGSDGRFEIYLPEGTYVAFARKKTGGERFGPLDKDDFLSPERPVIKIGSKMEKKDFKVIGLREAFSSLNPELKRLAIIDGALQDPAGKPAKGIYAVAFEGAGREMPDYISSPSDENGHYEIYIPAGSKIALGAAELGPRGFKIIGWHGGDINDADGEDIHNIGIVLSDKNKMGVK